MLTRTAALYVRMCVHAYERTKQVGTVGYLQVVFLFWYVRICAFNMCWLLLLSTIDTPIPPSGKPDSVVSLVPTKDPSSVVPISLDMRYYNALLREVPQECVSVPLVLHCMVEQVSDYKVEV